MDEELVDMERDGAEGNAECVSMYKSVPVLVHTCTGVSCIVTVYVHCIRCVV